MHLLAPLASLSLTRLTHCTVIVGGVGAAVAATALDGCVVHVAAAAQVRLTRCVDSDFHLAVWAPPVMEGCTRLRLAAADVDFPGRAAVVAAVTPPRRPGDAAVGGVANRWADVRDFDWLRGGASPNWEALVTPSQLAGPVRVGFDAAAATVAAAAGGVGDGGGGLEGGDPSPAAPDDDPMATADA